MTEEVRNSTVLRLQCTATPQSLVTAMPSGGAHTAFLTYTLPDQFITVTAASGIVNTPVNTWCYKVAVTRLAIIMVQYNTNGRVLCHSVILW